LQSPTGVVRNTDAQRHNLQGGGQQQAQVADCNCCFSSGDLDLKPIMCVRVSMNTTVGNIGLEHDAAALTQ
jgi:hypothetical protein